MPLDITLFNITHCCIFSEFLSICHHKKQQRIQLNQRYTEALTEKYGLVPLEPPKIDPIERGDMRDTIAGQMKRERRAVRLEKYAISGPEDFRSEI